MCKVSSVRVFQSQVASLALRTTEKWNPALLLLASTLQHPCRLKAHSGRLVTAFTVPGCILPVVVTLCDTRIQREHAEVVHNAQYLSITVVFGGRRCIHVTIETSNSNYIF